ncbi:MAG: DsrE/DsrF/DrsH-like family protein [Gammaproteobacteria bacterium]|nr:DsrE/DsrF/DrsH-like family protein [Gammaproteobacteria bacterium]MDH3934473.1 DsrE/DsrF/DrsH-like family protein [Gammaproteobacteria bacterium]MDH3987461.1 DsrE/DsrF/DrsH-like family protein [Gammaproteobacteria bacterium]
MNDVSGKVIAEMSADDLKAWFDQRFTEKMAQQESDRTPRLSIMVTKGTLDWAYPPFIVASTAAALGWDATLFFTFYGLALLKKDLKPNISPLGNPAMPMKMPFGPQWFQGIEWNMPNLLMAGVPGFENMATSLMKMTVKNHGVASIPELRDLCIEADVKMVACQMTVDLFGWQQEDFIPEVSEWAGAATYITNAQGADITLFV